MTTTELQQAIDEGRGWIMPVMVGDKVWFDYNRPPYLPVSDIFSNNSFGVGYVSGYFIDCNDWQVTIKCVDGLIVLKLSDFGKTWGKEEANIK